MSCAILIAGVLTHELKEVFGRAWPETWIDKNPSYFGNGAYGFFPFHGGRGYASFPSGHRRRLRLSPRRVVALAQAAMARRGFGSY